MIKDSISELLCNVDIFAGVPANLIDQFAVNLNYKTFNKGISIINKGEEGNTMFVIADGKVKIHDGEHVVAHIESGNFFGEFSLLDDAKRSMSVTAIDDVKVVPISREIFFKIFQSQPEVAQKIIGTLTNRLRKQNESIINQLKTREAELNRLVNERTAELKIRNEEITIKNKEITDNVNYAKRIQSAILPDVNNIYKVFKESFVLYMPKDIVSGDFFSFFHIKDGGIIVAADCTGHGVTGAFLSMIGNSLLTQIINEKKITDPGKILDLLHEEFITTLNQRNNESTDGMDVAICGLDNEKNILHFAGANRPMWLIRNNELIVYSPDKFPVGGLQIAHENKFTSHEIKLQKNDIFYISTDGYADQFGGESGKKLMTKKYKEILLSIQQMNMKDQKSYLKDYFEKWKGNNEQVDDVLVIGVRID